MVVDDEVEFSLCAATCEPISFVCTASKPCYLYPEVDLFRFSGQFPIVCTQECSLAAACSSLLWVCSCRSPAMTRQGLVSLFETHSNVAFGCLDKFTQEVAQDECPEMTEGQDSLSVPYGSYHQLYRIDGKLVAVGVVDILPKCLVSFGSFVRREPVLISNAASPAVLFLRSDVVVPCSFDASHLWVKISGESSCIPHVFTVQCCNCLPLSFTSRRLDRWLPFRQSSVYCFYDPAYRALALGKLTALKETEFVKEVRFTVHTSASATFDMTVGIFIELMALRAAASTVPHVVRSAVSSCLSCMYDFLWVRIPSTQPSRRRPPCFPVPRLLIL